MQKTKCGRNLKVACGKFEDFEEETATWLHFRSHCLSTSLPFLSLPVNYGAPCSKISISPPPFPLVVYLKTEAFVVRLGLISMEVADPTASSCPLVCATSFAGDWQGAGHSLPSAGGRCGILLRGGGSCRRN